MAESSKKKSRRVRRKTEKEAPTTGQSITLAPIKPEIMTELRGVIADIIWSAQKVTIALAKLECDKRNNCPLVEAARDLVNKVDRMLNIQRKLSQQT